MLLGLKVHPENPLLFDFIVDQGQNQLSSDELKSETEKLVKYFLAALTIPDQEVWVNLSPTEKDRIIPDTLGSTTMGKTMLEQDYLLKQLAASLTNPETELGKKYWDGVNKSLDARRLSLEQKTNNQSPATNFSSQVFRNTILPSIEKEVNEGQSFADVRQVYNSVILAAWYKQALKESLLAKVYADQSKVAGVESGDMEMKQRIYEEYLSAFKKGAYNLIREEEDATTGEMIPRKYFSGGIAGFGMAAGSAIVKRAVSSTEMEQQLQGNTGVHDAMVQLATGDYELKVLNTAVGSSAILKVPTNKDPLDLTKVQSVGSTTFSTVTQLPNQRTVYFEPPSAGMQMEYIAGYSADAFAKEVEAYGQLSLHPDLIEMGIIPKPIELGNIQPLGSKVAALVKIKSPYLKVQALPRAQSFENNQMDKNNGNEFNANYWLDKYILLAETYARIHAAGVLPRDIRKSNIRVHRDGRQSIVGFMILNFDNSRIIPPQAAGIIPEQYFRELQLTFAQLNNMIIADLRESFLNHYIAAELETRRFELAESLGLYELFETGTKYFKTPTVRTMTDLAQRLTEMKTHYQHMVDEGLILPYRNHSGVGEIPAFFTSIHSGPVQASQDFKKAMDEFKAARIEDVVLALTDNFNKISQSFLQHFSLEVFKLHENAILEFRDTMRRAYDAVEPQRMKLILSENYERNIVFFEVVLQYDKKRDSRRYNRALVKLVRSAFAVLTPEEKSLFLQDERVTEGEFLQKVRIGDLKVAGRWNHLFRFTQEQINRRLGQKIKAAEIDSEIMQAMLRERRRQVQMERQQVIDEADRLLVDLKETLPSLRTVSPSEQSVLHVILREVLYEGYYIFLENDNGDDVLNAELDPAVIAYLQEIAIPGRGSKLSAQEVQVVLARLGFENGVAGPALGAALKETLIRLGAYIAIGKGGSIPIEKFKGIFAAIEELRSLDYGVEINADEFAARYQLQKKQVESLLENHSFEQVGETARWMNLKAAIDEQKKQGASSAVTLTSSAKFKLAMLQKSTQKPFDQFINEKTLGLAVEQIVEQYGPQSGAQNFPVEFYENSFEVNELNAFPQIDAAAVILTKILGFQIVEARNGREGALSNLAAEDAVYQLPLGDGNYANYQQLEEHLRVLGITIDLRAIRIKQRLVKQIALWTGFPAEDLRKGDIASLQKIAQALNRFRSRVGDQENDLLGGEVFVEYLGNVEVDGETTDLSLVVGLKVPNNSNENLGVDILYVKGDARGVSLVNVQQIATLPNQVTIASLSEDTKKRSDAKSLVSSSVGNNSAVASAATVVPPVGGIDFNPANMNLQIKRDGRGVPLPLPQQNLEQINIEGLFPVIINIVPINAQTLPIFLGLVPKEPGREPELAARTAG